MTTQTTKKIRLVRCPRCKQVLPEPEIPVYKCGGCGVVLQAKNRKTDSSKGTGLNHDGTDASQKREVDSIPDEREINGVSQEATISVREESLPDTGSSRNQDTCLSQETTISAGEESSPDKSNKVNEKKFVDCNGEQPLGKNFSPELPNSIDLCSHEDEVSMPKITEQREQGRCEYSSDQDVQEYENQDNCLNQETKESSPDASYKGHEKRLGDCNGKQPDGKNFSHELPNSIDLCSHEDEVSMPKIAEQREQGRCEYSSDQDVREYKNLDNCLNQETKESSPDASYKGHEKRLGDCNGKQPDGKNFSHELPNSIDLCSHEDEVSMPKIAEQREQGRCEYSSDQDVREYKNLDNCLNQETKESSPDASYKGNEKKLGDCNGKQPGGKNFSRELPNSIDLCSLKDDVSMPEVTEQREQGRSEYNSDQDMQEYENEFGDSGRNWSRGRSFSDDFFSSMEFPCQETEDSSPEFAANMEHTETKTTSDQRARADQIESENCARQHYEDSNFLPEVSSFEAKKRDDNAFPSKSGTIEEWEGSKCILQHVDSSSNEGKSEGHRREIPQNANFSREISISSEIAPVMPSPVDDANTEVEEDLRVHNFDSLGTENTLDKKETGSVNGDDGSISSDNVNSSDDQQLGATQKLIPQGFGHPSTTNTPDNLSLGNVDLKRIELSKSPTRRYYAHDRYEDRIPGRFAKPPRRKFKHANFNNSNGLYKGGPQTSDFLSNNPEMQYQAILGYGSNEMLSNESEIRRQARKSSILPEKNHPTMKYRNNQDDLHDLRSVGHSIGGRMREDKKEHISRLPFIPIYPQIGQRKSNAPPYPLNASLHYSGFCSPDAPSYTEPDKMELLRVVNELKDELNRMNISNSRFPPRVSTEEKYTPLYSDHHPASVAEISSELSYSRYPQRYNQGKGLPQLNHAPRMAFSGDIADHWRHVDYACLHCHPQDWRYSMQLPSHAAGRNKVHCMGHSSTCYNGPCSASSSPHHYKNSQFSDWDCDTVSGEQRHRENAMKILRERYQLMKRHVRPVAGGTPIVACYHCSQLLQLPADFLLLGKRCHKLRCNACGKVMKFSLQNSKHLVPRIPNAIAPPPSVVDDCSDSIRQRNWASASHSNDNPYAEPFSCTDDYGRSFERSCSTEGEPSAIIPPLHHPVGRFSRNKKTSSGDSFMILEDRKMKSVLRERQKLPTKSVENLGSMGHSSKRSKVRKSSSEIKELPATGGSPLHRLMGYSSPSAVMKN